MKIHIGWMIAAVVVLAGMGMQQGESTEKWEYERVTFTRNFEFIDGKKRAFSVECYWPDCFLSLVRIPARDWPVIPLPSHLDSDLSSPQDHEWALTFSESQADRFRSAYNAQRFEWDTELDAGARHTGGSNLSLVALTSRDIVLDLVGQDGWQVFQVDTEMEERRYYFEYHLRRRIK